MSHLFSPPSTVEHIFLLALQVELCTRIQCGLAHLSPSIFSNKYWVLTIVPQPSLSGYLQKQASELHNPVMQVTFRNKSTGSTIETDPGGWQGPWPLSAGYYRQSLTSIPKWKNQQQLASRGKKSIATNNSKSNWGNAHSLLTIDSQVQSSEHSIFRQMFVQTNFLGAHPQTPLLQNLQTFSSSALAPSVVEPSPTCLFKSSSVLAPSIIEHISFLALKAKIRTHT